VIAFDHGELQRHREPLLAGIIVHGVLKTSDAHVASFLTHAERLTIDEWAEILTSAHERLPAVRRLRDAIAMDEPSVIGSIANERIAAIVRTLEQELRDENREAAGVVRFAGAVATQLTASFYAIERRDELGTADVAQLYAPFEPVILLASVG
jgi:hypothetical protein